MNELWYPGAKQDKFQDAGGFYESPWRGVLHTTEGDSYAGARAAYAKGVAPHFTASFEGGKFQCWQHIALNRAARALANPPGGVQTNRLQCIQIEIVAHAATAGDLQHQYLDGIGKLMRWIENNTGIQRKTVPFYGQGEGLVLATLTSPVRFDPFDWNNFNGWCGHQHVPENEHWDPGKIDINYLLKVDIGVRPMIDPPLTVKLVDAKRDKYTDGFYLLSEDGAVFAFNGAVFYKGVNGQDFFRNRVAAKMLWPEEAQAVSPNPQAWQQYKYIIQAQSGEMYGCPW